MRDVKPELVLCSPAQRARQTAELLIKEIGGALDTVQFDERICDASPENLLELIRTIPDTYSSAMFIGHNPSIGCLANQLSDTGIERMPTCAVATFELSISSWRDMGKAATRLLDFDHPKRDAKG